jgi:hypothetical protein
MYRDGRFAHTVRRSDDQGPALKVEGDSLRYAAIVALGLSCLDHDSQRSILAGGDAAQLARLVAARARHSADTGALALAAWAAAEVGHIHATDLFARLATELARGAPVETVTCAWTLTAALAASHLGDSLPLARLAAERLFAGQERFGLFPHVLPAASAGRWRSHVGCFADQVYPIQALARLYALRPNAEALAAAEDCAARIVELQGEAGQWWWHYDTRDGSVVEGYPVYSVHQHAMGPMALLELWEVGGTAHWKAIVRSLSWLDRRPELNVPLVSEQDHLIWRKIARREPNKAVRALAAAATALRPGLRVPGIEALFPPVRVDYECRPYELGWLLYAWLSNGRDRSQRKTRTM